MTRRLLLVEDDEDLARGIRFNLERDEFQVTHAADATSAREQIREGGYTLVLLDLNLPDGDGLDLLRELRDGGSKLPVICLTARGQETDVVMGLQLGADDYVKKPFGVAELLARIDALLRRAPGGREDRWLLGGVEVDRKAHTVIDPRHPERAEELTPIEYELLRYLVERRGQAVDRQRLLRDLWGVSPRHSTRTLDNHVARLRRKLERDPARPRVLITVHGIGYRLEAEET